MCKHTPSVSVLHSERQRCQDPPKGTNHRKPGSGTRPEPSTFTESREYINVFDDVATSPALMPEDCVPDQDLSFGPTQTAQQEAVHRRLFRSAPDTNFAHRLPSLILPAMPVNCCLFEEEFPWQNPLLTPGMEDRQEMPERSMQDWLNAMELVSASDTTIKSRAVDPGTQLTLPALGCPKGNAPQVDLPKPAFVLLGLLN